VISISKDTDFILSDKATILEAISLINSSSYFIAIVIDKEKKLIGTITDGDIRRGLIEGVSINDSCIKIMNKSPLVSHEDDSHETRLQIMKANSIKQLPVVNFKKEVVGLIYFGELIHEDVLENTMLIMAGGFGKRMQALTKNTPKPMLLLGEKPIMEHIILKAKAHGFRKFLISVHYLPEKIIEYFSDGSSLGVDIKYLHENKPLGTAGAISLIDKDFDTPLVITNGDLLIDINYKNLLDFHNEHNADATMAIRRHVIENPFGVVETENLFIKSIKEKPSYQSNVNAGIYVINNKIKECIKPKEYIDMPDLFNQLLDKNQNLNFLAYPLHEDWLDIGNPSDLSEANRLHK